MTQDSEPSGLPSNQLEQFTRSGDGVLVVDAEQRIGHWNETAAALLGYRREEVLGKRCYEVMKTRDCDGAMACRPHCPTLCQARKHHWASHHQVLAETKSGKLICLCIASFSLLSPERKFQSLAHIFWDVRRATTRPSASAVVPRWLPSSPAEVPQELFLTGQEQKVLGCLASGMDSKSIAVTLCISPKTVRNYVERILQKLNVHSRLQAVALLNRHRSNLPAA